MLILIHQIEIEIFKLQRKKEIHILDFPLPQQKLLQKQDLGGKQKHIKLQCFLKENK